MTQKQLTSQKPVENEPKFNVKCNKQFVGSAWLNQGNYGPYIKLMLNKDFAPSELPIFISPRKDAGKVFV